MYCGSGEGPGGVHVWARVWAQVVGSWRRCLLEPAAYQHHDYSLLRLLRLVAAAAAADLAWCRCAGGASDDLVDDIEMVDLTCNPAMVLAAS